MGGLTIEVMQYTLDRKGYERDQIREIILGKLAGEADATVIELCPKQWIGDDSQAYND